MEIYIHRVGLLLPCAGGGARASNLFSPPSPRTFRPSSKPYPCLLPSKPLPPSLLLQVEGIATSESKRRFPKARPPRRTQRGWRPKALEPAESSSPAAFWPSRVGANWDSSIPALFFGLFFFAPEQTLIYFFPSSLRGARPRGFSPLPPPPRALCSASLLSFLAFFLFLQSLSPTLPFPFNFIIIFFCTAETWHQLIAALTPRGGGQEGGGPSYRFKRPCPLFARRPTGGPVSAASVQWGPGRGGRGPPTNLY